MSEINTRVKILVTIIDIIMKIKSVFSCSSSAKTDDNNQPHVSLTRIIVESHSTEEIEKTNTKGIYVSSTKKITKKKFDK